MGRIAGDVDMRGYRRDLAYVHDAGFRDYALKAAPGLLQILRRNGVGKGSSWIWGAGSERWARCLTEPGYEVLGVDQSPAMAALARKVTGFGSFRFLREFRGS